MCSSVAYCCLSSLYTNLRLPKLHCREVVLWTGTLVSITVFAIALIEGATFLSIFTGGTVVVELIALFYLHRYGALKPLEKQIDRISSEATRFSVQNTHLHQNITHLKTERRQQQKVLRSLKEREGKLEGEIAQITKERTLLEEVTEKLKSTEKAYAHQVEEQKAFIKTLEQETSRLEETLQNLNKEFDEFKRANTHLNETVDLLRKIQRDVGEEEVRLAVTREKLVSTQTQLEKATRELESLTSRQERLCQLQEEISQVMQTTQKGQITDLSNLIGQVRTLLSS